MKLPEAPTLRAWNPDDESERNLVLAGWMNTFLGTFDRPRSLGIERGVMGKLYPPVVQDIVERSKVIVAHMPGAPDAIMAWMCWEGDVLHYVCVKPRWQRLGIASWLLADFRELPVTYTHRTPDGMKLPVPAAWVYAPMRRFREAA